MRKRKKKYLLKKRYRIYDVGLKKKLYTMFSLLPCIITLGMYFLFLNDFWMFKEICKYSMLKCDSQINGISREEAIKYIEKNRENCEFSESLFWKYNGKDVIRSVELNNMKEAQVYVCCGRSDIVFVNTNIIDYKSVNQCLISTELALHLFGSSQVDELEVEFQNRKYEIVDIIDSQELFFIYEPIENTLFDHVTIYAGNIDNVEIKSLEYKEENEGWFRIDYSVLLLPLYIILLIFVIVIGLYFIRYYKYLFSFTLNRFRKGNEKLWKVVGLWFALSGILILIFLMGCIFVDIPTNMFPDKWSNFGFWTYKYEQLKESWHNVIVVEKTIPDLKYIILFIRCFSKLFITICLAFLMLFDKVFKENIKFREIK